MTKPRRDDKQNCQSVGNSNGKDNMAKPFNPVEYYTKKLEEKGMIMKKIKPPKDRCWIWFKS
jgi:hypothetical protein